ncbi:hypothetical protein WUBG_16630 [Wuchereria bancrofti]|uniref:Uncharacterized protein n=1 Tax=Wuchereria bancrofti TaxID=6293 RepID=J9AEK1_WUCBA|nr:hypothetical protein WUBG_16630 [Wuchereria bancrofti]
MDHPLYKEAGSFQEKKIGEIIANNLADNDATLQTGIGAIPDATLASLANHKIGNAFRWSTKTLIAMQSQI